MNQSKHLWEVGHAYYCNEGNYFNNECGHEFKSFADFLEEMGNADKDYNLLFRWDWIENDDEVAPPYNGDPYYRNGKLKLFYMQQRRGKYTYCIVEVCRADESAVIEFLRPHFEYLCDLWHPLAIPQHSKE